jgi:hypothetical protein
MPAMAIFWNARKKNGPFRRYYNHWRFFGLQALFDFPIKDVIRRDVTDQQNVVTKSEGTCVVIGPDQHPRGIPNCPFKVGDTLIITYKQGEASVEKYQLKR